MPEREYWSGQDGGGPASDSAGPLWREGPLVRDPAQLIEVVALAQAVALIPRSLAEQHPRDDVVYRPVVDAKPYAVAAAWSDGSRAPHIARFVRSALELYRADRPAEVAAPGARRRPTPETAQL
ncbi:LysR substrate-binding domain-containing protein [Microbacterium sp.]|uniref:LysR substrate-binding domain-containing protein n=1 Tax=Microbacterium sp. TaxID=51671 RepID=UPI003C746390